MSTHKGLLMQAIKLNTSSLILVLTLLLIGCSSDVDNRIDNTDKNSTSGKDKNTTMKDDTSIQDHNKTLLPRIRDFNATESNTSLMLTLKESNATMDLAKYIPYVDKELTCQINSSSANTNGTQSYLHSSGYETLTSTHDGLDLIDYADDDLYVTLDPLNHIKSTQITIYKKLITFDQSTLHKLIPRYYDNNDTAILNLNSTFELNSSVSTNGTTLHFTSLSEGNYTICHMWYIGDFNISSTTYSDAIEMRCTGNQSKEGTQDNGDNYIFYNRDYSSITTLLPNIGIVDVNYSSPDHNFTIQCQP